MAKTADDNVRPLHSAVVSVLFREHHRALVAFLQCKLGSAADAQELAQEAYERVLTLERPERIESLRAYLYRTAANLAVDQLRQRRVREATVEQTPEPDSDGAPTPERHAAADEQYRRLHGALRELPAKSARAFVLHMIEGQDFDAIARSMQLGERMVRYHVARALEHCRARAARGEV